MSGNGRWTQTFRFDRFEEWNYYGDHAWLELLLEPCHYRPNRIISATVVVRPRHSRASRFRWVWSGGAPGIAWERAYRRPACSLKLIYDQGHRSFAVAKPSYVLFLAKLYTRCRERKIKNALLIQAPLLIPVLVSMVLDHVS